MEIWSFYFLLKLYLYIRGYIRFNAILNLLLAGFVFFPLKGTSPTKKFLRTGRSALGTFLAVALLYYDSWLPPIGKTISFLSDWVPKKEYIYRFLINVVNPVEIFVVLFLFLFCFLIRKRVTLMPVTVILISLTLPATISGYLTGKTDYLNSFRSSEAQRKVLFGQMKTGPDFDIIFLHVCSFSWDDLRTIGLENDPFLKQFQYLFTQFNSVTSYSNPAALRLMRANCGQPPHSALYTEAPDGCYLLESLRNLGYKTYTAFDHDGKYMDFSKQIQEWGKADKPIDVSDIPVRQYNFDGSPLLDNLDVLRKWRSEREASGEKRAVLYFNIVSMHGGSHRADQAEWWKQERAVLYKQSALKLFADLDSFFRELSASGRNSVVIFVPEHGMALKGSRFQGSDLREIPLPSITTVPVGIKLIGDGYPMIPASQEIISKPTSYLAISYMLSNLLKDFGGGKLLPPETVSNIPETPFLSENESTLIIRKNRDYFLYGKDMNWIRLSPEYIY